MDESLSTALDTASGKVQKPVQNMDLKRKLDDPAPRVAKKVKVDNVGESPKVKKLISRLNELREIKKQEKAGAKKPLAPWPTIFDHDGSPKIVVASFPATPERVSVCLSPISAFRSLQGGLTGPCPDCPPKDEQIKTLTRRLEEAWDLLGTREEQIQKLTDTVTLGETYRKYLHSQLVELKGPIRVMCRLKPLDSQSSACVLCPEEALGVSRRDLHSVAWGTGQHKTTYLFDRVFRADTNQDEVFDEIKPYVQSALDGDHVCIFTYGQTGSGKTYTLEGPHFSGAINATSGVIPRAVLFLFQEMQRQNTTASLSVTVSCLEIYNDSLYDLFSDSVEKLTIKTLYGKVVIEPLEWIKVANAEELLSRLAIGVHRRATRETHMNAASSRSHCVYQFQFDGVSRENRPIAGKLNIIDLAGSERSNSESYEGKSQKEVAEMRLIQNEAKFINTSLSCLRRVVSSLIANKSRSTGLLPPYRESKLTRILQDSLAHPDAKLLLIINICSGLENASETRESLKFGADAQFCLA